MTTTAFIYLAIALVSLSTAALFAGFENGMVSIRKARLDHAVSQHSFRARLIKTLLDRPAMMLATVLLGTNLAYSTTAVFFKQFVLDTFGRLADPIILSSATAVALTFTTLVFCEITPKVWFRQQPFVRCQATVLPVYAFYMLAYPIVRVMTVLVHLLQRLSPKQTGSDIVLLREDFRLMLRESQADGLVSDECRVLLENSLEYDHKSVRSMMIPKIVVHAVAGEMTLAQVLEAAEETEVSRFPVFALADPGIWIGTISIYDVIFQIPREQWSTEVARDHLRPLVTVPEESDASGVLQRCRSTRMPLLVVLDRDRKQVGIITPTDIVRPLFGNLDL